MRGRADLLFRLLHRLHLISVNHAFEIFYGEFAKMQGVGPEGAQATRKTGEVFLTFREIKAGEIERLNYKDGLQYDSRRPLLEDLRDQFRRGLRFFAAFEGETVVTLQGFHTEIADLVYVHKPLIRLPKGVVYANAAVVAFAYRNRGVGSALMKYCYSLLQQEGYEAAVGATFLENRVAARWHEKNDFKRWGRIRYICIS